MNGEPNSSFRGAPPLSGSAKGVTSRTGVKWVWPDAGEVMADIG